MATRQHRAYTRREALHLSVGGRVYDQIAKGLPERIWTPAGNVNNQRHRHIMRAHFGTYWNGTRGKLAIERIAHMVQESMAHGSDAISLFGEVSPFNTGAELNYLATFVYHGV